MAFAADLDSDSYSSLHYDMTHGKRMELDALHGAVVRAGREHEIAVPATETIYSVLRPWAVRNEERQAGHDGQDATTTARRKGRDR